MAIGFNFNPPQSPHRTRWKVSLMFFHTWNTNNLISKSAKLRIYILFRCYQRALDEFLKNLKVVAPKTCNGANLNHACEEEEAEFFFNTWQRFRSRLHNSTFSPFQSHHTVSEDTYFFLVRPVNLSDTVISLEES